METSEALEKIYFSTNENGTHYYTERIPFEREYIEYVRKDVFIEKAKKWFERQLKTYDIWHLQEKEDIYDAIKDWNIHRFICIMKDGTIQKFTGNLDEDFEGHIGVNVFGVNDNYDDVDDIVKWIELL